MWDDRIPVVIWPSLSFSSLLFVLYLSDHLPKGSVNFVSPYLVFKKSVELLIIRF